MKNYLENKLYIYTLPKSGTYLMSEFLKLLGSSDTGYHIAFGKYLDTLKFSPEVNSQTPSKTVRNQLYVKTFKDIPLGSHAFGHFNPLYLAPNLIVNNKLKFICIKRNPMEILTSEFIDFRYRRTDVAFVGQEAIADPIEAFEAYMEKHSPIIGSICRNFLLLNEVAKNVHYNEIIGSNRFLFCDFKSFINEDTGPAIAVKIAHFISPALDEKIGGFITPVLDEDFIVSKWREALDSDNKTKSSGLELPFKREDLWSSNALALYEGIGFPSLEEELKQLE